MLYQFCWKHGGKQVILTGNFDNWMGSVKMEKNKDTDMFEAYIRVDPREKLVFKYIIDGVWRCSMDYPTEYDDMYNVNNIIRPEDVRAYLAKKQRSRSASPVSSSSSMRSSLNGSPLSGRLLESPDLLRGYNNMFASNFGSLASSMKSLLRYRSDLESNTQNADNEFVVLGN